MSNLRVHLAWTCPSLYACAAFETSSIRFCSSKIYAATLVSNHETSERLNRSRPSFRAGVFLFCSHLQSGCHDNARSSCSISGHGREFSPSWALHKRNVRDFLCRFASDLSILKQLCNNISHWFHEASRLQENGTTLFVDYTGKDGDITQFVY